MPKPNVIDLSEVRVPILYEDRAVLAVDKPAGWMLAPDSWHRTGRNLQLALISSIGAGDFWARSRNIRYLRFIHRLDADTSGVLLLAKSPGALNTYTDLFRDRRMEKRYLAVVQGVPKTSQWVCRLKLGPDPAKIGRHKVDPRNGKDAETDFRVLATQDNRTLIEAKPVTGRTHQIRLHLQAGGLPIVGDPIYGQPESPIRKGDPGLGLRAVFLAYADPFHRRRVEIPAPQEEFLLRFGFGKP